MQALNKLLQEHDMIERLVVRLDGIARSTVAAADAAFLAVQQLNQALDSHLAHEDLFLYVDAMKSCRFSREIEKFRSDFDDLTQDWGSYLVNWSPLEMKSHWADFCKQTLHLMKRLRDRVAQENELLYPMALQTNRIRLRVA
jgi:Hemerythrin HHE cation binding domain